MQNFSRNNFFTAPVFVLALILAVSLSLMLWASSGDSAIMDELAHIPAGYGYVNNLDYRLNPEHPPLVKALSAIPLVFSDLNFPTTQNSWKNEVNGQWTMGTSFLYESGNDADYILRSARIAPIFLTLILIILIYVWSAKLLGNWWGLLSAFMFGLSPTILAHGHYVTTDIGAAFGIALSTYFFIKFLFSPSLWRLFAAGLAFGAAQLMKFSAALLIPYLAVVMLFFFVYMVCKDWEKTAAGARLKRFSLRAFRYFKSLIIIFVVGYIVIVYPAYFIFTLNYPAEKQASDTEFILTSFAGGPTPAGEICSPARCLADLDIWMSRNWITRPFAEYLLGLLMVIQRSDGGNTNYFMGEVSSAGSPAYFPTVYLLKETIPALIIIFTGFLLAAISALKKFFGGIRNAIKYFFTDYIGSNFAEFSMFVFVLFYWLYSVKSPLNIGVRHLIPTFPFIYILAASAWKRWLYSGLALELKPLSERIVSSVKSIGPLFLKFSFLMVLLFWVALETAGNAPYFLSYFNEAGGGTVGGYRFVTDSNYDWGQDLLRLQKFVDRHPEIDKIAIDYFGGGNPKYYLGNKEVDWSSSKGNPATQSMHWLAVSVNTLQGAIQPLAPGQTRNSADEYGWLNSIRAREPGLGGLPLPNFRAGTSIFVYKL
ncbi:MAG: glycosyltransferase family 39 protein [Candidatus Liptonbacteria bacterium]|nr:glycosyltransferase family 39 protein [Candidatus Liptonbacteria bacterium]